MPVVPDPVEPDRRTLVDASGVPLARFVHVEREGRTIADLLTLEVPIERALPAVLDELRGMRVAGPEELGRALVAAGGKPARHLHMYTHDLRERPAASGAFELTPIDRPAAELLPAYLAAHKPDHVDAAVIAGEDSGAFLARILAGDFGRLLDCSGLAIDAHGRVVGAILCALLDGPWVMELFRAPEAPGAGRALLQRALALCEGPALGLAVTDGNPAEALYVSLGFRRVFTAFCVDL